MALPSNARSVTQIAPKAALTSAMLGATVFAAAIDRGHPWLLGLGILMLVGSMILGAGGWIVAEMQRVNRPADDAFTEGYEAGFDRGWRDRDAETRPNLVVLPTISASVKSADSCGKEPHLPAESASRR